MALDILPAGYLAQEYLREFATMEKAARALLILPSSGML